MQVSVWVAGCGDQQKSKQRCMWMVSILPSISFMTVMGIVVRMKMKCLELAPVDQYKGCHSHSKNPRLIYRGNPVISQAWKNCVLASDKDGEENHVRHGCS